MERLISGFNADLKKVGVELKEKLTSLVDIAELYAETPKEQKH